MDRGTSSNQPILTTCEMYPRRRNTEFYRSPEPRVSCQNQRAEHPGQMLNVTPTRIGRPYEDFHESSRQIIWIVFIYAMVTFRKINFVDSV
uniref:IP18313p n=1 Tax=Drosophila melanogaster TaxID=7227 RepID=A2VES9_DROME|nr:IP18313p [Drosophila melanogaster]